MISLSQRLLTQPQYNVPLDTQGLAKNVVLMFNPSVGAVDLISRRSWTLGGNAAALATPHGKAFNFDGSGDFLEYTGYPEITGNVFTFFMYCPRVGAASAFGHIFIAESGGAVYNQVTNSNGVFLGGAGGFGSLSSWFNTSNRSLVMVSDGTTGKCYLDGIDSGITWGSSPGSWPSGNKLLHIGGYSGGGNWDTNASMLIVGHANRAWDASEAKAFHDSKGNALYKAPNRRLWMETAVSGGTSVIPVFANHYRNQGIM